MTREIRAPFIQAIEEYRNRRLVVLMNFDRPEHPPVRGLSSHLDPRVKLPLYRVLKESADGRGLDVFLYTRGGDTNAVWPLVSLLREFDPEFQVLVPFRCHSAGTLVALAARTVVMSRIAELSPIDPTTGNAFNPTDPNNNNVRLGVSVEDVQAYRNFVVQLFDIDGAGGPNVSDLASLFGRLSDEVHPLALGNVHRVYQQTKVLAGKLLALQDTGPEGDATEAAIDALTKHFYSHQHAINRHEASELLGDKVMPADETLDELLDQLLGAYRKDFELWTPYYPAAKLGDEVERRCRFVGGVVESTEWSYLLETNLVLRQFSQLPQGIQVKIQPGAPPPLLPGFPRAFAAELVSQQWTRNREPQGVDK